MNNLYKKRCIDLYGYCTETTPIQYLKKHEILPGSLCVRNSDNVVYKLQKILTEENIRGKIVECYDFGKFTVDGRILYKMFSNLI